MKKVISVLLILAMMLGCVSCAVKISGSKISVKVSNNGSKTVGLRIDGEIGGYRKEVEMPEVTGGASLVKAELKSDKPKAASYKITGYEPGSVSVRINIYDEAGLYAQCQFAALVDEEMKVHLSDMIISDTPEYTVEQEEFKVIDSLDGDDRIFMKNDSGEWKCGEYDAEMLSIDEPYITHVDEDDFSVFTLHAKNTGDTKIQLVNPETSRQILLSYTITSSVDGENTYYHYKMTDYFLDDYDSGNSPAAIEKRAAMEKEISKFGGTVIPPVARVKSYSIYNKQTKKQYDPSFAELPADMDTLSMDLDIENQHADYEISRATTFAKACKAVEDLNATALQQDITVKDVTARYYHTTYGFGEAIWEIDGAVYKMVFMGDNQTSEKNILSVQHFLEGILQ